MKSNVFNPSENQCGQSSGNAYLPSSRYKCKAGNMQIVSFELDCCKQIPCYILRYLAGKKRCCSLEPNSEFICVLDIQQLLKPLALGTCTTTTAGKMKCHFFYLTDKLIP